MARRRKTTNQQKPRRQLATICPRKCAPSFSHRNRKPHRFRPGTVALSEIRKQQKSTKLCIPKAPVVRYIKEILQDYMQDFRTTQGMTDAIHEASEAYLIELLRQANLVAIRRKRVTLTPDDIKLVRELRGENES